MGQKLVPKKKRDGKSAQDGARKNYELPTLQQQPEKLVSVHL